MTYADWSCSVKSPQEDALTKQEVEDLAWQDGVRLAPYRLEQDTQRSSENSRRALTK